MKILIAVPVVAAYDENTAIEYAKLAGAAYCSAKSLEAWSCGDKCSAAVTSVKVCQGDTTKAFVGQWDGTCVVSFEGTSNVQSFLTDLEFWKSATDWDVCDGCKVHSGFLKEYKSLQQCVKQSLGDVGCPSGSSIRSTGHSLGAAIDGIAMMDLHSAGWKIEESYNFGMPRTGNEQFAAAFNQLFSSNFYRVTHHRDPVVQVPPDALIVNWHFKHTEPEVFYKGKVADGFTQCSVAKDKKCSGQFWDVAIDLLNLADHLDYMGTSTSFFDCTNSDVSNSTVIV
jgi:hypothetical protein